MDYRSCLDYLYARLPMFQRVGKAALKPNLDNTLALLDALGNPHLRIRTVHIAGTNGKGSSAHALSAILQSEGYKTGLFTSPHLVSFTERIRISGSPIDEQEVVEFVVRMQSHIERISPSFFEVTAAMAFDHFHRHQVDLAVIETGLGGRLDSTNVIMPVVSLITHIGYDHTDLLGETLTAIAGEKAGIIKPGVPVVIGTYQPEVSVVFEEKARDCHSQVYFANQSVQTIDTGLNWRQVLCQGLHLELDLAADYYLANIPGVLKTIHVLRNEGWPIADGAIIRGLKNMQSLTGLKGRYQVLGESPLTIADISHNVTGIRSLINQVERAGYHRLHLVYGTVRDKEVSNILSLLPKQARYYFTQSHTPRALPVAELVRMAHRAEISGPGYEDVNQALADAQKNAGPDDLILVTGSTFVVAEIKDL